jgi:electron-transferring-flavoprotein dehydrogenase
MTEREKIEVDVLIVGGGPAGLSTACRLAQIARERKKNWEICLLEKGSEIGAHLISGAVLEPRALDELFPDWKTSGAPLGVPVKKDRVYYNLSKGLGIRVPGLFCPSTMHNKGNHIISIGELCRWLAERAEELGVTILPGFPAESLMYKDSVVKGVITKDMGVDSKGAKRANFEPGVEVHAKYTLLAEGARGHLGGEAIKRYKLDAHSEPQRYGLGIKEIWETDSKSHHPGTVVHSIGWPLSENGVGGGGFLYHAANNQIAVGLISDLDYSNPYVSPYDEFQRYKHHPAISSHLKHGKRIAYGARAISKGGWHSMPDSVFPGGLLIGCNMGSLNFAKIKGIHMAMKSGLIAAETAAESLDANQFEPTLDQYAVRFKSSWAGQELFAARNVASIQKHYGTLAGAIRNYIEINFLKGKTEFSPTRMEDDRSMTAPAREHKLINYPKPDGVLSFDKNSSVFLSNTNHEEEQPCHLQLEDPDAPIKKCLPEYAEPAQRYCPAGVYEVLQDKSQNPYFQINAQNCVHCKTCDIKDPIDNIRWVPPEGGGGPNYSNM